MEAFDGTRLRTREERCVTKSSSAWDVCWGSMKPNTARGTVASISSWARYRICNEELLCHSLEGIRNPSRESHNTCKEFRDHSNCAVQRECDMHARTAVAGVTLSGSPHQSGNNTVRPAWCSWSKTGVVGHSQGDQNARTGSKAMTTLLFSSQHARSSCLCMLLGMLELRVGHVVTRGGTLPDLRRTEQMS